LSSQFSLYNLRPWEKISPTNRDGEKYLPQTSMGILVGNFFYHVDENEELKPDGGFSIAISRREATGVDRRGLRAVALIAPRDVHG
jgi:hypothetical protein